MSYEIIPAILSKTFREIEEKAGLVKGLVDTVQVDTCDGRFADALLWPFTERGETGEKGKDQDLHELFVEKKELPFGDELDYEFDLMVREPEGIIGDFVRIGASRLLIHLESTAHMEEIIHEWKETVELGIALKPRTSLEELDNFAHEVRRFQLMGNDRIAHSAVSLDPRVFERLRELRKRYPNHAISVDIGVNLETAPRLIAAGADTLVAGSAIFGASDPSTAIAQFKSLLYPHTNFEQS